MTDQRTFPSGHRSDDPFERELRLILRDRAAGSAPAALHETLAEVTRRATPRPTTGWRRPALRVVVAAAGVLLLAMGVNPVSTWMQAFVPAAMPSPSTLPSPRSSATPAIAWDNGTTRLTADSLRLTVGGQVYTAGVPGVKVGGDGASLSERTLEVEWREHDRPMRLYLYLASEHGKWWVSSVATYDGSPNGDWIIYGSFSRLLPQGATWSGDLQMVAPGGMLEIEGMTLRAFGPESLPAELRFCRPAIDPGSDGDADPLGDGEPLAGTGIETMTPVGADALLRTMGLCHTFRYGYPYSDDSGLGYSEVWCDPPPGVITELSYGGDGEVIVFVSDATPQQHTPRPQPPVGWGC